MIVMFDHGCQPEIIYQSELFQIVFSEIEIAARNARSCEESFIDQLIRFL